MPHQPLLGPRLLELLRERGWTQQELARRAGVGITTVSKHVNNHNGVKIGNQERYAQAFGLTVTELLADARTDDQRLEEIHRLLVEARDGAADRLEVIAEALSGIQAQLAELRASLGLRDVRGRGRADRR